MVVQYSRFDVQQNQQMYTPFVLNYHWTSCNPVGPRRPLADQLQDLGVKTSDIDTVLFRYFYKQIQVRLIGYQNN